jgi:deoxyribose-phosphate aldolase
MQLNQYIDHTLLKPTTLMSDVEKLCQEAKQHSFAAVCVPPMFVKGAKQLLANSGVKIATVVGFPFGYSAVEAKIAETLLAIVDGADELDVVINLAALKNNDWQYLGNEINHLMQIITAKNKVIKVIIESGVLTDDEIIKCCDLYGIAGVHFVKTSTGYAEVGATVHAVRLIRKHLADVIKIKASGGIKTKSFAEELIEAGANRIGASASVQLVSS